MILRTGLVTTVAGLERLPEVSDAAEKAATQRDPAAFFATLRASDVPFLPRLHHGDPAGLFKATVAVAHVLGESSPGLALGVSQHLASMWAFELTRSMTSQQDALAEIVGELLESVYSGRLLIANTTSQAGGRKMGASGSTISWSDGSYVVEGWSTYMSLASEADKLTFVTRDANGAPVGVITDLTGNDAIHISEELLFGDHLVLADTRRVRFERLVLPERNVIRSDPRLDTFYLVQLVCQNLCSAALYLGGAHRLIEETKLFGHGVFLPSGEPLSSTGAFSSDVGEMVLVYMNALRLLLSADRLVEELDRSGPTTEQAASCLRHVTAIKHSVAKDVEQIAINSRKLLGARSFMSDHPVSRIGGEIVFGALGPGTEKATEREFGQQYLEA